MATVAACVGLASYPLGNWVDQQEELDKVRQEQIDLENEIEGLKLEISSITGEDGIKERGKCFGPFVEPGSETYSIHDLYGCIQLS